MEILSELRLANVRNGLAYPHDDLCYFQSNHGHRAAMGYFRGDAMPLRAVVHLLCGSRVIIIDGTSKPNRMSDALRYGVPTWCAAFNEALGYRQIPCDWITDHAMVAARGPEHKAVRHTIEKLADLYGTTGPIRIGWRILGPGDSIGESGSYPDHNLILECHRGIEHDDRPERLAELMR